MKILTWRVQVKLQIKLGIILFELAENLFEDKIDMYSIWSRSDYEIVIMKMKLLQVKLQIKFEIMFIWTRRNSFEVKIGIFIWKNLANWNHIWTVTCG